MQELKRDEILSLVLITECFILVITAALDYLWNIDVLYNINITMESSFIGLLCSISLIICNYTIVFILPKIIKPLKIIETAYSEVSKLVINCDFSAIILIAILTGISEELLFRGILQDKIGIIAASILFGLLHIASKETIVSGIYAIFIGLFLGYTYIYTGNLWVPIIIHIINNAIAIPVMKWHYKKVNAS